MPNKADANYVILRNAVVDQTCLNQVGKGL